MVRSRRFLLQGVTALAAAALAAVLIFGCNGGDDTVYFGPQHGVVAFNSGWIGVVHADNQSVVTPFLVGELGTSGSGLFDVAITPNGKTALVSSFGADNVYIVDLSNPKAPALVDNVTLSFFAEDIEVTPDGRYALVTDGGFSPKIAVIDIENRTLVEEYEYEAGVDEYAPSYQSVAVAKDGRTVLAVDYFGFKLNVLTLADNGSLTWQTALDVTPDNTVRPVNVSISPNGKTAIVAGPAVGDNNAEMMANMGFPVFKITGVGEVEYVSKALANASDNIVAAQTVVFSRGGGKAYANCVRAMPESEPDPEDADYPRNAIVVLDVDWRGNVDDSTRTWPVEFIGRSQLFGVDTIAVDPNNRYLWVSNMTMSGAKTQLQRLKLSNGEVAETVVFDNNVTVPPDEETSLSIPAGISFAR